jgi:hypothetical protein
MRKILLIAAYLLTVAGCGISATPTPVQPAEPGAAGAPATRRRQSRR